MYLALRVSGCDLNYVRKLFQKKKQTVTCDANSVEHMCIIFARGKFATFLKDEIIPRNHQCTAHMAAPEQQPCPSNTGRRFCQVQHVCYVFDMALGPPPPPFLSAFCRAVDVPSPMPLLLEFLSFHLLGVRLALPASRGMQAATPQAQDVGPHAMQGPLPGTMQATAQASAQPPLPDAGQQAAGDAVGQPSQRRLHDAVDATDERSQSAIASTAPQVRMLQLDPPPPAQGDALIFIAAGGGGSPLEPLPLPL